MNRNQVASLATGAIAAIVSLPSRAETQDVHDSSGIRVVAYRSSDHPTARWYLSDRPIVLIGGDGATGPAKLASVAGVVQLSDGALAVALLNDAQIRVFDSTGTHIRTIGRQGRGKGQFPKLWRLFQFADTLIGVDGRGVGQVFSKDGQYVRLDPRPRAAWQEVQRIGYLKDGSIVGYYADGLTGAPQGTSIQMLTLVHIEPDGTAQTLGRFRAATITHHGQFRPRAMVYGPRAAYAAFADVVCIGFSDRYAIQCLDPTIGKPSLMLSRKGVQTTEVTEADRQLFFVSIDSANPLPRGEAFRREVRAITDFGKRFPPFGRFVASTDNRLWVGPATSGDGGLVLNPSPRLPTTWSAYDLTGRWLSDVTIPAGVRLLAVARDRIVGLARTRDGAEQIQVFRIIRGSLGIKAPQTVPQPAVR